MEIDGRLQTQRTYIHAKMFGKRYKGMYYFLQLVCKSKVRDVREKQKER